MSPSGHLFRSRYGPGISVQEWNPSGNAVAVLIHGLGDGAYIWGDFAEQLLPYYKILALDLRGHGASEKDPSANYLLDHYVADVQAVLSQVAPTKYVFVGHSMGGDIVAKIASGRPKNLIGTILVDAGPGLDNEVRLALHKQLTECHRVYSSVDDYFELLSDNRPLVPLDILRSLAHKSLQETARGYEPKFDIKVADVMLSSDDVWWWSALKAIDVPTLLIRGQGSAILSKEVAARMTSSLSRGSLITVNAAGHAVMSDNLSGFCEAVLPFLRSLLESVS